MQGVYNLYPKVKYLPIRLHLLSLLNEISMKNGIYIPIIPQLLEILKLNIFTRKLKNYKGNQKPFEFLITIRLTKEQESDSSIITSLFSEIRDLWIKNLCLVSSHLYFNEFILNLNSEIQTIKNSLAKNSHFRKEVNEIQ